MLSLISDKLEPSRTEVDKTTEARRAGPALPLANVASIQSQYEQSRRYKYSDPAVVLMSKVYQTTDSIHVETATLPGNNSTNGDRAGVCLSLSVSLWDVERECERVRLLITAHNATSFSVYRPHWVKLSVHSQDQNHCFFKKKEKKNLMIHTVM